MDISLVGIRCDDSLTVAVVEDTFAMTCDDRYRCPLQEGTTAQISGQFVLNGFQNYANDGGTYVTVAGLLETRFKDYEVRKMLDLCGSNDNNNGNACPSDGTYDFSTSLDMPGTGGWWGTGFGARANLEIMAPQDGTLFGSCVLKFATPVHRFGIPFNILFITCITLLALVVFVTVFLVFGQEVFTGQRLKRMKRMYRRRRNRDEDNSIVTKATTQTGVSAGYAPGQEDSGAYDATTQTSVSQSTQRGSMSHKTNESNYTADASAYTTDSSFYTYETDDTTVGGVSAALSKAWRVGGLVVDRIVSGKPFRTPPPSAPEQQAQIETKRDDSRYAIGSIYYTMEDEASRESRASSTPNNKTHKVTIARDAESTNSIELGSASSTYSSVDLNCDSMDVQVNDRRTSSKFSCGAHGDHASVNAVSGLRYAAERFRGWFVTDSDNNQSENDNNSKPTRAYVSPQEEVEVRDEYHDMNVYTFGDGERAKYAGRVMVNEGRPVSYWPSGSEDSWRDGDSSIMPAVPGRQTVRFNISPEYQAKEHAKSSSPPLPEKRFAHSDSLSVHTVLHGNRVDGERRVANQRSNMNYSQRGAFVPFEDHQPQWKRQERWTAASINRYGEV